MKFIQIITFSLLFFGMVSSVQAETPKSTPHHVSILSVKREILYFKVDSEFMGANVEVYDSTGVMQFNVQVTHKRTLVDFFTMPSGNYTVRFVHGALVEEHRYSVIR